ncbi:EVE domain-containing protein [Sediminicurvatus halobius]|uniref:EVE domain-containing protein n=1 Tax=Sediminicurvatus halobius TaxID=2182432 RepID=A0A2U2N1W0_9GAMM|nr:EVE domain-containing protein [Spiribacter halobius]PWG62974.1 EVE domain-containing protein [Spiribacter halobius]UEX77489.1 EVE domain-containing protein [Spiribacter halobius]
MRYWLMKSEPDVYGIEHLAAEPDQTDHWDGVRNYQVRNMMRDEMRPGDLAFFYHSNTKVPGIAGIIEIVSEGYPDHTAFDPESKYYDPKSDPENPRWYMVDVRLVRRLQRLIPLPELKANPALADMPLVRKGNRLSVMPVTPEQWAAILAMETSGEQ